VLTFPIAIFMHYDIHQLCCATWTYYSGYAVSTFYSGCVLSVSFEVGLHLSRILITRLLS